MIDEGFLQPGCTVYLQCSRLPELHGEGGELKEGGEFNTSLRPGKQAYVEQTD